MMAWQRNTGRRPCVCLDTSLGCECDPVVNVRFRNGRTGTERQRASWWKQWNRHTFNGKRADSDFDIMEFEVVG